MVALLDSGTGLQAARGEVWVGRRYTSAKLEVATAAYMIIFGSSANNFVDGMSIGAAFSDSLVDGLSISISVIAQQFPQELG